MKNGFFMALVLAIWGILKLLFKFLKKIVQLLTSLIIFLGLYIPLFYLLFGVILLATTPFTFGGTGTDQILYYIGFGLSCVASVIIAIRNLLVRPFSSVFSGLRRNSRDRYDDEYEEESRSSRRRGREYDDGEEEYDSRRGNRRRQYQEYEDDEYEDRRMRRGYRDPEEDEDGDYSYRRERRGNRHGQRPAYADGYGSDRRLYADEEPERPLVYYSRRRPGILVKEYSDRFELFSEDASGQRYVGTEYKED